MYLEAEKTIATHIDLTLHTKKVTRNQYSFNIDPSKHYSSQVYLSSQDIEASCHLTDSSVSKGHLKMSLNMLCLNKVCLQTEITIMVIIIRAEL